MVIIGLFRCARDSGVKPDITANISINTQDVDMTMVGSYSVTYNVSDAVGNVAIPMSRTINVVAAPGSGSAEEDSGGGGSVSFLLLLNLLLVKYGLVFTRVISKKRKTCGLPRHN